MSLEEKVGQMLQLRVYADYDSLTAPEFLYTQSLLERFHIGSVELGARQRGPNLVKPSPLQVATVLNALQQNSKIPLLVGADLERGLASRLSGTPEFPFPMSFGAVNNPELVERMAATTAKEARAIGVHWVFAPVADLNSNPANPTIATRSFGDDPAAAARLVAAYIRGAHQSSADRLLVTVKHFPGEGNTSTDPHVGLTSITATRAHLEAVELVPFREAIEAGADSVMLAQAAVPAIEPDASKVATTSPKVVGDLLQTELGFKGLVVTDALEMRGVTDLYPKDSNVSARVAIDAINAGDDVLTLPRDLSRTFTAIVEAVRSGAILESRIDQSVRKILLAKVALGLDKDRSVDVNRLPAVFGDAPSFVFAQSVEDDAVTLVRNDSHLLPLRSVRAPASSAKQPATPKVAVVTLTDSKGSRLGPTFDKEFAARMPGASIFHYYNDQIGSEVNPLELLPLLKDADVVIVAVYVTHTAPRQISRGGKTVDTVGFAGPGAQFLGQVLGIDSKKTIVISLGSPYLIENFPAITNYICTYSLVTTGETSAVRALFGEIDNHATLPVDLPNTAKRGSALRWPHE